MIESNAFVLSYKEFSKNRPPRRTVSIKNRFESVNFIFYIFKILKLFFLCIILNFKCLATSSLLLEEQINKNHTMRPLSKNQVNEHPHNAVLSVRSHFDLEKGKVCRMGTAFLINERFALTAAHVVYYKDNPAFKVECYIKKHSSFLPTDTNSLLKNMTFSAINTGSNILDTMTSPPIEVKEYVCSLDYTKKVKIKDEVYNTERVKEYFKSKGQKKVMNCPEYDYALLYLGDNSTLKEIDPIEPIYYYTDPNNLLMFCGYPGLGYNIYSNVNHEEASVPYEAESLLLDQKNEVMIFKTLSFGGMSGSPIRVHPTYPTKQKNKAFLWKASAILSASIKIKLLGSTIKDFDELENDKIKINKVHLSKKSHNEINYKFRSSDSNDIHSGILNIEIENLKSIKELDEQFIKDHKDLLKKNLYESTKLFPETYACRITEEKMKNILNWQACIKMDNKQSISANYDGFYKNTSDNTTNVMDKFEKIIRRKKNEK